MRVFKVGGGNLMQAYIPRFSVECDTDITEEFHEPSVTDPTCNRPCCKQESSVHSHIQDDFETRNFVRPRSGPSESPKFSGNVTGAIQGRGKFLGFPKVGTIVLITMV